MKWFEGDIPTAIKQAKENKAIFVVYISGQDDVSKEMEATWSNADVSSLCEENGCVALRLQANSDTCAQFSMIYPVVCVPSTFFIGENGVPLEVTGGSVKPSDFVQKIKQVLQLHKAQLDGDKVKTVGETSGPSYPATTPEGAAPSSSNPETSQASDQSQSAAAATDTQVTDDDASSSKPLDDKVERARRLLAKKQAEKAEKAKEEQRLKELERRKMGQEVVKLKQWQKDQHKKEEMDEWKKEKEEQKREKERVLRELARDREEKKAKFQAQKEERAKTLEEVKQKKLQTEKSAREKSEAAKMEHAHLQFRLPDGSAITNQFSSQDTLQVARDFLSAKIGNSFGNFHLTTTYPKRRFRDDDLPRTLLDLELAPSAVIVVIPDSSRTVSRRGDSGTSNLLMTLLAPLLIVWNFLYALVFGTASEPRGAYNPVRTSQTPNTASASETVQRSQGRERPKSSYGLRRRQEGNMMRLSAVRDEDDDDTATWNGNSTQQM